MAFCLQDAAEVSAQAVADALEALTEAKADLTQQRRVPTRLHLSQAAALSWPGVLCFLHQTTQRPILLLKSALVAQYWAFRSTGPSAHAAALLPAAHAHKCVCG